VLAHQGVKPEDFMLFLVYLYSLFKPIKVLSGVVNSLQSGFAAGERVFGLLDTTTEELRPRTPATAAADLHRDVVFSHVTFRYPGCDETVLRDISFTLKKGQVVALVGPSGSGKSTVLDLLPRFYDIQEGAILLDGTDVCTMDLVHLRRHCGIVAQETVLFNDTVYNNIAYGVERPSEEQVMACAKAANAWEFVQRMPQGLNTQIGERGEMLSGGQRQRLAIARALLRNPPILILDEATSALDTESERLVQSAIDRLMENRTALVVAHRLSTIRHADQILFLDAGRIVEQGTHDELMAAAGRYRALHDLQFSVAAA
jgi:subfamily B ATP-binding cassette protein MsbA